MFELTPEQEQELNDIILQMESDGSYDENQISTVVQNYIAEKEAEAQPSSDVNFQEGTQDDATAVPTNTESASEDSSSDVQFKDENEGYINRIIEESNVLTPEEEADAFEMAHLGKKEFYDSLLVKSEEDVRAILGTEDAYEEWVRYRDGGELRPSDIDLEEQEEAIRRRKLREYTENFTEEERVQFQNAMNLRDKENEKEGKIAINNYNKTVEEYKASEQAYDELEQRVLSYVNNKEEVPEDLKQAYLAARNALIENSGKAEKLYSNYLEFSRDAISEAQVLDAFSRTHSVGFRANLRGKEFLNRNDRISIEIAQWLNKNVLDGTAYDLPEAEAKLDKRQEENIAEAEDLAEIRANKLWAPLEASEIRNLSDFSEFFWTGLADNYTSIGTMALSLAGPPGVALGSYLLAADVAGAKVQDIEAQQKQALKVQDLIDFRNSDGLTDKQKNDLDDAIKDMKNTATITNGEKWISAGMHAGAEVIFERVFGFGKIFDDFANTFIKMSEPHQSLFRKMVRDKISKRFSKFKMPKLKGKASKALKAASIPVKGFRDEATEEVFTQISQNAIDIYYLGQDKDLFEGVETAALQGGLIGAGLNTTLSSAGYISKGLMTEANRQKYLGRAERVDALRRELSTNKNLSDADIVKIQDQIKDEMADAAIIYDEMIGSAAYLTVPELADVFDYTSQLNNIGKRITDIKQSTVLSPEAQEAEIAPLVAKSIMLAAKKDDILEGNPTLEEQAFLDGRPLPGSQVEPNALLDKFKRRKERLENAISMVPEDIKKEVYDEIKKVDTRINKVESIIEKAEQLEREETAEQETQAQVKKETPKGTEKPESTKVSSDTKDLQKQAKEGLREFEKTQEPFVEGKLFSVGKKGPEFDIAERPTQEDYEGTGVIEGFQKNPKGVKIDKENLINNPHKKDSKSYNKVEAINKALQEANQELRGAFDFYITNNDGQSSVNGNQIYLDVNYLSPEVVHHEKRHALRTILKNSNPELYSELNDLFEKTDLAKASEPWLENYNLVGAQRIEEKIAFVAGKARAGDTRFLDKYAKDNAEKSLFRRIMRAIANLFRRIFNTGADNKFWSKLKDSDKFLQALSEQDFIDAISMKSYETYYHNVGESEQQFQDMLNEELPETEGDTDLLAEEQIVSLVKNAELLTYNYGTFEKSDKLYFGKTGIEAHDLISNLSKIIIDNREIFQDMPIHDFRDFVAREFVRRNIDAIGKYRFEFAPGRWGDSSKANIKREAANYINVLLTATPETLDKGIEEAANKPVVDDAELQKLIDQRKDLFKLGKKRDLQVAKRLETVWRDKGLELWEKEGKPISSQMSGALKAFQTQYKALQERNKKGESPFGEIVVDDLTADQVKKVKHATTLQKNSTLSTQEIIAAVVAQDGVVSSSHELAKGMVRMSAAIDSSSGKAGAIAKKFKGVNLNKMAGLFLKALNSFGTEGELSHSQVMSSAWKYSIENHPDFVDWLWWHNDSSKTEREAIVNDALSFTGRMYDFFVKDIFDLEKNPFRDEGDQNNVIVVLDQDRADALLKALPPLEELEGLTFGEKVTRWTESGFFREGQRYLTNNVSRQSFERNDPTINVEAARTTEMQEDVPVRVSKELNDKWLDFVKRSKHKNFNLENNKYTRRLRELNARIKEVSSARVGSPADELKKERELQGLNREVKKAQAAIDSMRRELFGPIERMNIVSDEVIGDKNIYQHHGRYLPGRHHTYSTLVSFQTKKTIQPGLAWGENDIYKILPVNEEVLRDVLLDAAYTLNPKKLDNDEDTAVQWAIDNFDLLLDAYYNAAESDLLNNAKEVEHAWRAVQNFGRAFILRKGEKLMGRKISLIAEIDTIASGITNAGLVTWDHKALELGNMTGDGIRDAYPELASALKKMIQNHFGLDKSSIDSAETKNAIKKFSELLAARRLKTEVDAFENPEKDVPTYDRLKNKAARVDKGIEEWKEGEEQEYKQLRSKVLGLDAELNAFMGISYDKKTGKMTVDPTPEAGRILAAYITYPSFEDTMRSVFKNPFMTIVYDVSDGTLGKQLASNMEDEFIALDDKQGEEWNQLNTIYTTGNFDNAAQQERYFELENIRMLEDVVGGDQFGIIVGKFVRDTFERQLPTLYKFLDVVKEFTEFFHQEYGMPEGLFIEMTDPVDGFVNVHEKYDTEYFKPRNVYYSGSKLGNVNKQARVTMALPGTVRDLAKEIRAISSAIIHGADKSVVTYMKRYLNAKGIPFKMNHDGFNIQAGYRQEVINAYNEASLFLYNSDYLWSIFRDNLPNHQEKAKEFYEKIIPPGFNKLELKPHSTGYGNGLTGTEAVESERRRLNGIFDKAPYDISKLAVYQINNVKDKCS